MQVFDGKWEGRGNGGMGGKDIFTWIARRARPNRIVKGFENADMAIPPTRPIHIYLSQHFTLILFILVLGFLLCVLTPLLILLFILLLLPPFLYCFISSFLPHAPTHLPKKGKGETRTDQEYCRSLFLSIILHFLRFLFPADAEILFAEVVIAWTGRKRRRMMIRSEGLVGAGAGECW